MSQVGAGRVGSQMNFKARIPSERHRVRYRGTDGRALDRCAQAFPDRPELRAKAGIPDSAPRPSIPTPEAGLQDDATAAYPTSDSLFSLRYGADSTLNL